MKCLLLLLCCTCSVQAQFARTAAFLRAANAVAVTPGALTTGTSLETNIASQGYLLAFAMAWTNTYTTNGSTVTWNNLTAATNTYDFTNRPTASKFPSWNATGLGSYPSLKWDGASSYLKCANLIIPTNTSYTIVLVGKWNDQTNASARYMWHQGDNAVTRDAGLGSGTPGYHNWADASTSVRSGSAFATNRWVVWMQHENGSSSLLLTNNITDKSGTMTTNGIQGGLTLGARYDGGANWAPLELACIAIFTNGAPNQVPVAVRSNAWFSITNFYGGSNFLP